ncbi:putative MO25-like protein At5g47540 isoform X2 [Primulina eburnea]|uniref:putative MO25-like protein At5g47540 isoform X2 n=1 Tax=Primulina eburnea TaxID=1245227 RepID=UPI003C6C2670
MKSLFKSKPKAPADLVRQTRDLLVSLDLGGTESKRDEKMMEMSKLIRELKQVLYGNSESESVAEACAQLTSEFFRENTLRLLIICLPKLNLEVRKDISQVVAKLQRQQVQSRLIECDYLEKNLDLLDILLQG